ncbi:MAG: mechanosensitive ion channel [Alphaproteobacteria bacterium]|nr:mechanosensitive ion channel [Alphaproteobacteria bacterium]
MILAWLVVAAAWAQVPEDAGDTAPQDRGDVSPDAVEVVPADRGDVGVEPLQLPPTVPVPDARPWGPEPPWEPLPPPAPPAPPGLPVELGESPVPREAPPPLPAWAPARGVGSLVLSLVLAVLVALGGVQTERLRVRLAPRGLLPFLLRVARTTSWVVAGGLLFRGIAAVAPQAWLPWLPVVPVALLLLSAWAMRALARDIVATMILTTEGRLRPGWLVTVGPNRGVVDRVGLRATWLRDAEGQVVAVPNHRLLRDEVRVEPTARPEVVVTLDVPDDIDPVLVRERLAEAALLSPWRAPDSLPVVDRGEARSQWTVTVRVLDLRFVRQHRETVREVAYEGLALRE